MGRQFAIAAVALLAACAPLFADETTLSPKQLAAKIDQRLEARWAADKVVPAPNASDSEFVRRVYLDLIGRIPRVSEVREFLSDPDPDKRAKLIDRLMNNAQFVTHWSNTWRDIILPAGGNQQATFFANTLRNWIEQQIRKDVAYDKMVSDLLATPTNFGGAQGRQPFVQPGNVNPLVYFQAHEFKPENLAASTARVFLGVRLECAQCHDHPFAKWSQTDFWGLAAFYSGMQPNVARPVGAGEKLVIVRAGKEIKIPGKEKIVKAQFPSGEPPIFQDGAESRRVLASWVTSKNNPYFARTAANRIWAHCFGMGLLDPCDDEPTEENPIRHPELLADLTQQFIAHDFDLKYLIRSIMLSKAYQRTSVMTDPSQKETQAFARMPVRGMTPEQLFDSLTTATGYNFQPNQGDGRIVAFNDPSPRGQFLNRFATQERRTETQTSILQALSLMNGKFISDATSLRTSNTLAAIADVPFMTLEQKLDTLFLAALSRTPRAEERDRLMTYVQRGGVPGDQGAALADVFWVLLNTSEFLFNH